MSFPQEMLEEFDLVGTIVKKLGPIPWTLRTFWKGTRQTSRQRHDRCIFNKRSNVALAAWNHRYVSLLPIVHDRTCMKQHWSSAMERKGFCKRLLKTGCDLHIVGISNGE